MKKDEISALFSESRSRDSLSPSAIPALNLYIDQILTLFAAGSPEEQALTKAMVNNYSKEKLIRPIQGKKYPREQVLQLLCVCRLKNVLSMGEIKAVTNALMEEEKGEAALQAVLEQADSRRSLCEETAGFIWQKLSEDLSEDMTPEQGASLALELAELSQMFGQMARQTVAQCFPQPVKPGK